MVKKKSTSLEKVKFIFYIIIAVLSIGGAVFGIEKYFAKTVEVDAAVFKLEYSDQLMNERLEISIIDDQIFQQQQQIQRIEDWKRFEQRKAEPELTPIEKDTLNKAKKRLSGLEKKKEEKIQRYENGRENY